MEPLTAAPPARGTSKGGPSPPRSLANCPARPPRPLGPGSARYLRGGPALWSAAPGPTSSPAPASYVRRLRPASRRRPPAAPSPAPPSPVVPHVLAGGGGAYGCRCSRTTFATRGCVTGRHVPGQRVSRPSAPAAGPGCRPEAWSGHDSLPGAPLARRVFLRPRLCYPRQGLGTPWAFYSWADRPPLNGPQICQRHSNIKSLSVLRPARAQSLPLPATWGPGGERVR